MSRTTALAALACVLALGLSAGCDKRGPAEKAGEKIDHAWDTIKNGGHEPVGDSIKDDVDKARDKVADAVDEAKDAARDAKDKMGDAARNAKEKMSAAVDHAKDKVNDAVDRAKDKH
jgi:hypothetical protein